MRHFLILLMLVLTAMAAITGCGQKQAEVLPVEFRAAMQAPAVRGEFVSLRETQLMAPFVTEVIELIPEGTAVAAGQEIAKLSAGDRQQTLKKEQSELEKSVITLEGDKVILVLAGRIEQKNLDLAAIELDRRQIEYDRAVDSRDWLRLVEQEEAARAGKIRGMMLRKQFEASEKMSERGFSARQELADHEKDLKIHILTASLTHRLIDYIDRFADEKKVFEASAALERAKLGCELASFTAPRNLSDYQMALNQSTRTHKQVSDTVAKVNNELASLTIRAPVSGILLYGETYDGSQLLKLRRGAQVYPGLTFLKLVDDKLNGVNFPLDQRDARLVSSTTPLFYRPDALPEMVFPCTFASRVPVALEIPQAKPDGRTQVTLKANIASYPASLMLGFSGTVYCYDFVSDMCRRFSGSRRVRVGRRSMKRLMSTSGDVKPASASFIVANLDGKLSEVSEEGKTVKAGDPLAVIDCEELIQSARDSEIELKKKNEEYQLQLQKNTIECEKTARGIEVRKGAWEVARLKHAALLKRREEDKIIDLKRSLEVLQARISLAQEKITHLAELRKKGLGSELESLQAEAELAEIRKDEKITAYKLRLEESGPTERSVKLSELDVRKAEVELEKAQLEGELTTLRNDRTARLLEADIKGLEISLAQTREEIESASIKAPTDGVVILNEFNKAGGGLGKAKVGDSIYARIPFMQVADVGNLQIHCTVSEMDARFIKRGDEVKILLKGNSNRSLRGWVDSVGIVAVTEFRKRQDATVSVIIALADPATGKIETDPSIRPGTSCEVEFKLYDLADSLFVPFDALLPTATASCIVTSDRKIQPVQLLFADGLHGCAVASGLQEGDEILLMEPVND